MRETRANLEALAAVLRDLGAASARRACGPALPAWTHGRSRTAIRSRSRPPQGDLDILGTPSGTDGYDDLARAATAYDIEGARVLVASIDDLMRMKRAAGRVKDLGSILSISGRFGTSWIVEPKAG